MDWKQRLEPFADIYADAEESMQSIIKVMGDADLVELLKATEKPTATNCWYCMYQVREAVKAMAEVEQTHRRNRAAAEQPSR